MIVRTYDVLIVGSGAAGFAAACRLRQLSAQSVAILTEDCFAGTSRNTGSDKQTYYKLNLGGSSADSVRLMAEDLFACGCVDGDTALCEAALSARCFSYLADLGVPFPHTAYGEYVGYKTDHDPYARASSAGPLSSKYMTEALQRQAEKLGVPIIDHQYAVSILKDGTEVCGLAAVDTRNGRFSVYRCRHLILATGGPAGIYAHSVYPESQIGASSLAINAGAAMQNLTEWQYGLASTTPRWNVSGSYMQVLPRFLSVDESGEMREFLTDYFSDARDALAAVFLKGYQWPFDASKAKTGSSRVDLAVYTETVLKGRNVFLDYTKNPFGVERMDTSLLSEEACAYLSAANALGNTPYERLEQLNAPAAALYRSKGVDLRKEMLPIALCAQHMNGGVSVDADWQTTVPGLYAVGECAGTHGITRPGGSALNAGQAGALRTVQHIVSHERANCATNRFLQIAQAEEMKHEALLESILGDTDNTEAYTKEFRLLFSGVAAAVRRTEALPGARQKIDALRQDFCEKIRIADKKDAVRVYRLRDMLDTQAAMLECIRAYNESGGASRGSAVYPAGDDLTSFTVSDTNGKDKILQLVSENGTLCTSFRPVRPIPAEVSSFEAMWKSYRDKTNPE